MVRDKARINTAADPAGNPARLEAQPAVRIPDLIQRLRHKEPTVRKETAEILGLLGAMAREAIPALLVSACDIDAPVRKVAATALAQVDPGWPAEPGAATAVPDLIKEMGRRPSDIARTASLLLSRIGRPAIPRLAQAMSAGSGDVLQVLVAQTLGRIGPGAEPAVPALAAALTSEYTHVRQAAAEALAAIGSSAEPAVPALISLLADWSPGVRKAATLALARVGRAAEVAASALIHLLADRDEQVREAAVEALVQVGPGAALLLQEFLQIHDARHLEEWMCQKAAQLARESAVFSSRGDERLREEILREPLKALRNLKWGLSEATEDQQRLEMAREAAVGVLGKIGPAAGATAPILVEALSDNNARVRSAAARALGQVGPAARDASPALVRALVDKSQAVRKATAEALTRMGPGWAEGPHIQSAIEALIEPLKQSGDAGQAAADAFVLIGSSAVPVLAEALAHQDRVLREAAATTLGRIGAEAQSAIPALVRALQDGHTWVREAAARALEKIDPEGLRRQLEPGAEPRNNDAEPGAAVGRASA